MAFNFSDIFKNDDSKGNEDLTRQTEKLVSMAKKCLSNPDFEEYRKQLVKVRDKMLERMVANTKDFCTNDNGNVEQYAFRHMRMVTQYADLKVLLDAVESDVRREKKDEADDES